MKLLPARRRYAVTLNPANVVDDSNALLGGGQRIRGPNADMMARLRMPWQTRALTYYDLIGEVWYAAQFYSRMLTPLRLYAAEKHLTKDGLVEIVETDNAVAVEQLERIQDPGGGRTGLLGAYGRLMFLAGEAVLFCTHNPKTDEEQWEMLSTDELRVQGKTYMRFKAPSLPVTEYHEPKDEDFQPVDDREAVAYRVWQRHPRYSDVADSAMAAVLDICEELLLLTQAVRARAKSRLAGAGVLFIDDKISPAPQEAAPDEDPKEDPFIKDLTESMTTPIMDEGTAAAVVPLVVRVPVPEGKTLGDLVYHLQIVDPIQLYPETGLRRECIERLGIGLDMPPEILTGLATANHWTGWAIDEQTWKGHGQQKAQQLCDDLSAAFYRPTLKELGVPDWEKFVIAYDASAVVNHPSRSKDAKDLYDRRAISKAALRDSNAFDESDAPPEDELNEAIGVAIRDGSYAKYGVPSVRGGTIEPVAGQVETAANPATGVQPDEVSKTPPEAPPVDSGDQGGEQVPGNVVGSSNGRTAEQLTWEIVGACDLAFHRAREAAGNRVRSLARRDKDAEALLRSVPVRERAAALGRTKTRELMGRGRRDAGAELELVKAGRDLVEDALRIWGLEPNVVERLVAMVEQHAAMTLYERRPPSLPPTLANYAKEAVSR